MYTIKRVSKMPGSAMRIQIAQPDDYSTDAGLAAGGTFWFEPAGTDGDSAQLNEYQARVIMGDAGLAPHFTCTPALPAAAKADDVDAIQDDADADAIQDGAAQASKKKTGRSA